jgi:hypothetical protein
MDITPLLDNLEKLFTILAITAGGLWAYFNFFRGRTYRPRLEAEVGGQVIEGDSAYCLLANLQLKNIGLSRVIIKQEGSGLRLFVYEADAYFPAVHSVEWTHLATFSVFEQHQWIESGETINEQRLIALPEKEVLAFKLGLRVVSQNDIVWHAEQVIAGDAQTVAARHTSPTLIKESGYGSK